jgi:cyclohexa-1,5-dienecarbonyl-CoA hydratase
MAYKHIQTEFKEGVATLTLNRPPLNVLNIEMMEEINTYFEGLLKEKALKLLVIQAAGKAFSAGVDVGEHLGELVYKMIEVFHKMFRLMDALKVPSIALVNEQYIATWLWQQKRQSSDNLRSRSGSFPPLPLWPSQE